MKNKAMKDKQIWCTQCWWKTKKLTWRLGGERFGVQTRDNIGYNKCYEGLFLKTWWNLGLSWKNQEGSEPKTTHRNASIWETLPWELLYDHSKPAKVCWNTTRQVYKKTNHIKPFLTTIVVTSDSRVNSNIYLVFHGSSQTTI